MAFRLSNNLVGILNFVVFLLSIPILAGGIWLSHRSSTDCEKFLQTPIIVIGAFLLAVSLCGLVGACCRNSLLLWIYLLVMFLLIVLLFCLTVFAFVVTNKGAGEVVSGRGYKEYRLGDYSNWLQKRVENSKNWRKIRSCLVDSKVCQKFEENGNRTLDQFVKENLSPLQVYEFESFVVFSDLGCSWFSWVCSICTDFLWGFGIFGFLLFLANFI